MMQMVRRNTLQLILLSFAISLVSYYLATYNSFHQLLISTAPAAMDQILDQPVDVMIIGGGPAGLSAATTLYRHKHTIRIFDHGKPRNSWNTRTRALPGFEGIKPSEFRERSKKELDKTGLVDFVAEEVTNISRRDNGLFYVQTSNGMEWSGRKVLLAMGVHFQFLDIPGYQDCFPERMQVLCEIRRHSTDSNLVFIACSRSGSSTAVAQPLASLRLASLAVPFTQTS
jgi:thioredoxin reductase